MRIRMTIVAATLIRGFVLTAGASAEHKGRPITFRFLVDSPSRPPNNALEWVDGSPDDVVYFEGLYFSQQTPGCQSA
jgi:hypothetical protein